MFNRNLQLVIRLFNKFLCQFIKFLKRVETILVEVYLNTNLHKQCISNNKQLTKMLKYIKKEFHHQILSISRILMKCFLLQLLNLMMEMEFNQTLMTKDRALK